MNAKNLITALLLLFVAASVVAVAVNGMRRSPQSDESQDKPPAATTQEAEGGEQPFSDGVIAYYFHRTERCPTCTTIEAYAQEAVETGFAKELDNGQLRWRVVNYSLPENEHYKKDYELIAPTVVLVELSGGKEKRWKDLPKVWDLVGDKAAFVDYVQQQTREFLELPGT